jgi:type II secretion system protein L
LTALRVLVRAAADASSAPAPWALYDAGGECVRTGCDAASGWPDADTLEFVVGASDVRLASLALPPMPAARVAAAAAFALEDRLAGPADEQWLAVAPERHRGRVIVAIVARALVAALRARTGAPHAGARILRIVAEPELADAGDGCCWCIPDEPGAGSGFVRLADGSAFPVSAPGADATLPAELQLALAQGRRDNALPARVRVDGAVADAALAQWQRDTGVAFERGSPWRWHAAPAPAFAAATNLLQREFAPTPPPAAGSRARLFAPALALAAVALALHVIATLGEWVWWRVDAWRTAQATIAVAAGAGIGGASTPDAARAALTTRYADERHARGLPAPDDALPLFARAAPALAALPPGSLKTATYGGGHWTLDLQAADPALLRGIDARLRQSGTPALIATTPTGARLRIGGL